jgi:putative transposase
MRKSRFAEERIVGVLKGAERTGRSGEMIRGHGICRETFYRWQRKYGGLEVSDAERMRTLEEENGLKRVIADQAPTTPEARRRVPSSSARTEHSDALWVMVFVHDTPANGRCFRACMLVDTCTRECLSGIEVGVSMGAERVVWVLNQLRIVCRLPERITCGSGPSYALVHWTRAPAANTLRCISCSLASRCRTRTSRASTDGCVVNASADGPASQGRRRTGTGLLAPRCATHDQELEVGVQRCSAARPPRGLARRAPVQMVEEMRAEQITSLSA